MKKIIFNVFVLFLLTNYCFAQQFKVSFADTVFNKPFTGYVLLYLSKENKTPKSGTAGEDNFPCFSLFVENVKPGTDIIFDDKANAYPVPLSDIERGEYYVQAVWDRNLGGRAISESPGNIYSASIKVKLTKDFFKTFSITANKVIPEPDFKETQFSKQLVVQSGLLSSFHKKPITINGAVLLPREYYNQPKRKFPVLFYVFGYGSDYHYLSGYKNPSGPIDTTACITVYLDGNCPFGHCVYANSDNNGPWGDALTNEFIPQLEKLYRCNGARLLTGHSSGGWTVLWLQTHYPKIFHACWSSSPDPVDFRNFSKVNLYADQNMYYAKDSTLVQTGTIAGYIPWFDNKTAYRMEHVIYRGEQMQSMNAVFGKRGKDGLPQNICNSETGVIDPVVVKQWKEYDISLYVRNNWTKLKPDLDGKVRVTAGKQDNFFLNESVMLLDAVMQQLNSKFEFAYYPGDHFTVATAVYRKDGDLFLEKKYREWLSKNEPEGIN
jgi:hypothetical protein